MPDRRRVIAADLTVDDRDLRSKLRRDERIVAKTTRAMQRDMMRVESGAARMGGGAVARGQRTRRLGGVAGVGGGVGGMLKGAAVFGGVYGLGSEVKKAKQFEEVLGKNKGWMDKLRGSTIALSNEFGVGKDQLADYVGTVVDLTGDTELAVGTLRSMTAVAFSANVPMKALAGTVVEMQSKLALAPHQFETALGVLASQADKGKVPLSQMSLYLPEVLNAASAFGHKGIGALRDYGAVLQMAARGAGSLAEANTAMNRMLDNTIAKRTKIEKVLNIKLKRDNQWLGLAEMLKLISGRLAEVQKAGGQLEIKGRGKRGKVSKVDVEKFVLDIWGIRGKKAMLPMIQQAMAGWGQRVGAKGGQGGMTSFDALLTTGGASTIKERVARKRKLSPELDAWNKGVERLKNRLHMHLLPAIKKIGDIIPAVSSALEWMIDNWKLLLVVWGSTKMLRFFNTLTMAGGGLRGAVSTGARLFGLGGATAAATGGGGLSAAGLGGLGGLAPAVSTASTALGAFGLALAPAAAGLHELAKAYDPKKQKELRDRLTKEQREGEIVGTLIDMFLGKRDVTGKLRGFTSLDELKGRTQTDIDRAAAMRRMGVTPSEAGGLRQSYAKILGGKYAEGFGGLTKFGLERTAALAGKSDYELAQLGMSKEMAEHLAAFSRATPAALESLAKGWTDLAGFLKQHSFKTEVKIVDPNKTASGVTQQRQTVKK
jgi:hypothetical protein